MARDSGASDLRQMTEPSYSSQDLVKATEEAERHQWSPSQYLENKSHEIRTYITRIVGMTDLTLMTELTEDQRDYLTIVSSSTRSLLKVLNDILDYSKIQAQTINLELASFDLRRTIQEVVDLFHIAVKQKNISLKVVNIDKIIPQNLIGDALRLKQVLSNLVGNSVRFTNYGEITIKVELEQRDENRIVLKFTVSDTGIGIPADMLVKQCHEPGQGNASNLREFGGSGFKITRKLIALMDGDIDADCQEGVGSTFCFTAAFGL